jgi:Lon protease-like protein
MAEQAVVFDKAAWHLDAVRERGLPDHQAYVHGGLFFGWAVRRGHVQRWIEERTPDAFAAFRAGTLTGPGLLARWDGAMLDDMFTDEGLAFVSEYFDPRTGAYFSDYLARVAKGLESDYHVADDAVSAAAVDALLDERFAEWRVTWDPAEGRPNLRVDLESADEPVPDVLRAPVLTTSTGVALPHGPLSLRATRKDSVVAVDRALQGDRLLLLVAPETPGRVADPAPADLLDVGVVARVTQAKPSPDKPGSRDVVLQCLHRVELDAWETKGGLTARATRVPAPEPEPEELELLASVRKLASAAVKARAVRGQSPGTLGVASVVQGEALLDVIARELMLSREERLIVLLSTDLSERARTVIDALSRELA